LTINAEELKNAEDLTYEKEGLVGILINCGRVFF
jgi:hypothetical protein